MDRREFLASTALTGGALLTGGCKGLSCGTNERLPYGDTVGDRLWMWGHHAMSFASMRDSMKGGLPKEGYNLPFDRRIDMADACRDMGIPGCFIVRWRNLPAKDELPEYMKQFRGTKRLGFSITDQAPEPFEEKIRIGLGLADRMPNLTTFVMDDYFSYKGYGTSVERIRRLKDELSVRGMKLDVVLYADANGLKDEYREILSLCDEVTYWFWHGKNVDQVEERVNALKDFVGADKSILLGQYMYDFGGLKPLPGALMERQLEQTTRLLSVRAIDGVIFHCTPLVDMNLDAVNVTRVWIREHARSKWGAA